MWLLWGRAAIALVWWALRRDALEAYRKTLLRFPRGGCSLLWSSATTAALLLLVVAQVLWPDAVAAYSRATLMAIAACTVDLAVRLCYTAALLQAVRVVN